MITLKTPATYDTQDAFSGSCLSFGIKKCIASCFLRRNERGEELWLSRQLCCSIESDLPSNHLVIEGRGTEIAPLMAVQ